MNILYFRYFMILNKRFTRITRVIFYDLRLNNARCRDVLSRLRCLIRHSVRLIAIRLMNTTTIRASDTRRPNVR